MVQVLLVVQAQLLGLLVAAVQVLRLLLLAHKPFMLVAAVVVLMEALAVLPVGKGEPVVVGREFLGPFRRQAE